MGNIISALGSILGGILGVLFILFLLYYFCFMIPSAISDTASKRKKEKERKRNQLPPILECANCGFKVSDTKWIANAGCPQCGGDVYEG